MPLKRQYQINIGRYIFFITMSMFSFWYAYFDTLFTKKFPTASRTLVSMIPASTDKWPQSCALTTLCQCFSQLQSFILLEKNWSESICTIDELNSIEANVTNVLLLLEIEKLYISNFWNSKRRVEASVTHLYALLQIFIGGIIPYDNMTLFECKAANKLCVKIVNLQDMFKSLMRKINSICEYFFDPFFDEEDLILRNFFQNFVEFMKVIPKVKKVKMFHVSQLLKYVVIVNAIEIASLSINRNVKRKMKLEPSQKQSLKNSFLDRKAKSLSSFHKKVKNQHWVVRERRKKCFSCPHKQSGIEEYQEQYMKTKNLLRFIFPTWIRRHSIKHRKESLPKLNIEPIVKGKSNSQFRRPESPGEERKVKYRNKSATKSRLLFKSQSLIDNNLSPTKKQPFTQKFSMYQTPFDEDDQSNEVQILGSATIKVQRHPKGEKWQKNNSFSILGLTTVKTDEDQKSALDELTLLKQIQKIVSSEIHG